MKSYACWVSRKITPNPGFLSTHVSSFTDGLTRSEEAFPAAYRLHLLPSSPFAMPDSSPLPRPEIHGHRGCRGSRPENTLPAFLHALALGVDVLELDVVISADKQVVVSHEPWLNPDICLGPDGTPLDSAASSLFNLYLLPYATIRRCDCGQVRQRNFPEQVLQSAFKPLLRHVFAAVEQATPALGRLPVRYSVEVKSSPDGDTVFHPIPSEFLALVLAELHAARVIARTTLMSFDPRILQIAHQQQPDLATCLLVEANQSWNASLHALGFVPTTFGPDYHTVSAKSVQSLRTAFPGLRLVPWTVNEMSDIQRLLAIGVDGLTSDYPERILALQNRRD